MLSNQSKRPAYLLTSLSAADAATQPDISSIAATETRPRVSQPASNSNSMHTKKCFRSQGDSNTDSPDILDSLLDHTFNSLMIAVKYTQTSLTAIGVAVRYIHLDSDTVSGHKH